MIPCTMSDLVELQCTFIIFSQNLLLITVIPYQVYCLYDNYEH